MQKFQKYTLSIPIQFISLLLLLSFFNGCHVQLVADYDQATVDSIINTFKQIDNFYVDLLNTPAAERKYEKSSNMYNIIESDLRVLLLKNSVRPLNEESTQMTQNILDLWIKYRNAHKENDGYKDALLNLHRERFYEMFSAMLKAEKVKPTE